MTEMPEKLAEELKDLRNRAFKRLKTDKEQFSLVEQGTIQEIIQNYQIGNYYYPEMAPDSFIGVAAQIYRDIRVSGYKKYDCIAMWLDHENGLAKDEPELIKRIAIEVGGLTSSDIEEKSDGRLNKYGVARRKGPYSNY